GWLGIRVAFRGGGPGGDEQAVSVPVGAVGFAVAPRELDDAGVGVPEVGAHLDGEAAASEAAYGAAGDEVAAVRHVGTLVCVVLDERGPVRVVGGEGDGPVGVPVGAGFAADLAVPVVQDAV